MIFVVDKKSVLDVSIIFAIKNVKKGDVAIEIQAYQAGIRI